MILYVVGIDTGIGKTVATGLMAKWYAGRGLSVVTQKLVQTGCEGVSEDVQVHRNLMGVDLLPEDHSGLTCPYVFRFPGSPHLAASLAGQRIDLERIDDATRALAERYDVVLVEGVGGLCVPLTEDMTTLDFVAQQEWPVVLVISPRLGSLNHTLLSLEALHARRLSLAAVLYNLHQPAKAEIVKDSRRVIEAAVRRFGWDAEIMDLPADCRQATPAPDLDKLPKPPRKKVARAAHRPAKADLRFDRVIRLVGPEAMDRIRHGHVAVYGLGGVGSYAAEGLARSGVGTLTLVDFDRVCITNFNRQLQAVEGAVGKPKGELMAARVRQINPDATVHAPPEFYSRLTADRLLSTPPDILLDCIDNVTAKMHLLVECLKRGIPVITVLGAAGKLDPTRIRVVPLAETYMDPLARAIRKFTKRRHGVTVEQLNQIVAVFSAEPAILPRVDYRSPVCGVDCVCPGGDNPHHSCRKRHVIYGSAVFVTGAFGMVAAGVAVRKLASGK